MQEEKENKIVFIVMQDDCNEGECNCTLESIDSAWFDKKLANKRASKVYLGHVVEWMISDATSFLLK